jgi:hypothetical protein
VNWLELSIRIGWAVVYASVVLIALTAALDYLSKRTKSKFSEP